MGNYEKFIDQKVAQKELHRTLREGLGRELKEVEIRTVTWLADCEYHTIGVINDFFKNCRKNSK